MSAPALSTQARPVVLIAEELSPATVEALGPDFEIRTCNGADRAELIPAIADVDAILFRSATKVDAEGLAAARRLKVVARAGVGLDNVDVKAATQAGVMVVNAPTSNIVSAAELAVALMLAAARHISPAHAALRGGEWKRSKYTGIELYEKTVGIVGLGRIGVLVAQRLSAFGMKVVAYDPYVQAGRAAKMGVRLVDLDTLLAEADFMSVHLPKTPETAGLIGAEQLHKVKPSLVLVNAARGGIVDEAALYAALKEGRVAAAGLDVFATEPCTDSPLFALDSVVATPHLGASTLEAQDKAGVIVAEQVALALAGDFVPFAVNIQASEAAEEIQPFLPLAERLGTLFFGLTDGMPETVEIEYQGNLAEYDTRIMTLSVLRGLLSNLTEEPVTYVNAPQLAESRGLKIREVKTEANQEFVNLVTLRAGDHSIAGTLAGTRGEARIVTVDDHAVDVPPASHMVFIRNDDRPGVIGRVGTVLGDAGVNIADMGVGQSPTGESALMVIATSQPVPADVLAALAAADGVTSVHAASRNS